MRITADFLEDDNFLNDSQCSKKETKSKDNRPLFDKPGFLDDVIPRLKHLHLSEECETYPPLCLMSVSKERPNSSSQNSTLKREPILSAKGAVPKKTFKRTSQTAHHPFWLKKAFAPKAMEKADKDNVQGEFNIDAPAPSWLTCYLETMKQQIKKEILEAIRPASSTFKPGKVEESQLDFQGEVIHTGIFCDNCDQLIHGIRYKCGNCSDFDLCQECESLPNIHDKHHVFLKIRFPIALKMYQRQKWQEIVSPTAGKIYMSSRLRQKKKLYEAKFVSDETIPDSTAVSPSTKFVKSWRVINSGTRVWTHATKLHLIQGSQDLVPSSEQVDVPHLKPGEEGVVSVHFTSPSVPGIFRSHWNFCHKSRPFGDIVWCHIVVKPPKEDVPAKPGFAAAKNLSQLATESIQAREPLENKQKEVSSSIAEVLTAVQKEHDRGNLGPRKLIVSSHTATPNNTPFDLTPPKSPDHHIRDLPAISASNSENYIKDSDDECSIVSLGSSDSDTEFVVIPMPKCFNLSESFVSQHMPEWLQEASTESSPDLSAKSAHKLMQIEKLEMGVINGDVPLRENTGSRKTSPVSETVSQETGVPELSVINCDQTVLKIVEKQSNSSNVSCAGGGGSSSEVSIIESSGNSPEERHVRVENATQTVDSVSISFTSDDGVPEETIEVRVENNQNCNESILQNHQVENQHLNEDNHSSATFPKFPIEGITNTFDPSPVVQNEERVVQVLPEGLVTGALSAAASVYNTARAVISTMQQPRNNNESCLSQQLPAVAQNESILRTYSAAPLNPMEQLIEMGFCNRQQNEELLKKHKGDVNMVVAEFVNLDDNDWYASRHLPSPPPNFD